MRPLSIRRFDALVLSSAAAFALLPGSAMAQSSAESADDAATSPAPDIVVTGTLLRGQAPAGSSAIKLGAQKLGETAATSANGLLATLPQVTN